MDIITGSLVGVCLGEIVKDAISIAEQSYIDSVLQKDIMHYNEKDIYCLRLYNAYGMYVDHSLTA